MNSGFTVNRFAVFTVGRPSLDQFVLLSLMLHVLVILLFGDTTGSGARRGEKMWGALTVTVQSLLPERNAELKSDAEKAVLQRPATGIQSAPAAPKTNFSASDSPASASAQPLVPADEMITPVAPPSFEMPPLIAKEIDKPVTEFVVPKASLDRAASPSKPTPLNPPIAPVPRETPPVITTPEPVAPSKIERVLATPIPLFSPLEPVPREEVVSTPAPALPAPAPPTRQVEPLPKTEQEIVKPVVAAPEPKPREVIQPPTPTVPVAPVTPIATPKPEPERVQTIAPPAEVKPREIPAAAPPAPAPAAPSAPQPAEAAKTPQIEREVATPTTSPAATKAAPTRAPTATPGAPSASNADSDLVKPRGDAIAPSNITTAPGKTPGIDLDAVRRRAREIGGSGPRTVFPFPVAPQPVPKTKVQEAFDKALKKNDCRDAYADMGLAAVVPLVLSAVREDGCRW